ncbi:MAG: phosphoenolpyruvate-utilizing N-terminal domain-containing protein [Bacteroidota bacterium]
MSGVVVKEQAAILAEIEKFDTAVQASVDEIVALKQKLETGNGDEAGILETQIELLTDPQIKADVVAKITMTGRNANDALIEVTKEIVALFKNMDDEYMRARSADMEDISNRILKNLNQSATAIEQFESDTILIADDITPSDTITMDVKHILGLQRGPAERLLIRLSWPVQKEFLRWLVAAISCN